MTSDIVERLRQGEPCTDASGNNACRVKDAASGCTCAVAADTITTLRAEVETLRGQHSGAVASFEAAHKDWSDLRAEVEKLRAALREISQFSANPAGSGPAYTQCGQMVRIARAALAEEKKG